MRIIERARSGGESTIQCSIVSGSLLLDSNAGVTSSRAVLYSGAAWSQTNLVIGNDAQARVTKTRRKAVKPMIRCNGRFIARGGRAGKASGSLSKLRGAVISKFRSEVTWLYDVARVALLDAGGKLRSYVLRRDGGRCCTRCGVQRIGFSAHHVIPASGGRVRISLPIVRTLMLRCAMTRCTVARLCPRSMRRCRASGPKGPRYRYSNVRWQLSSPPLPSVIRQLGSPRPR